MPAASSTTNACRTALAPAAPCSANPSSSASSNAGTVRPRCSTSPRQAPPVSDDATSRGSHNVDCTRRASTANRSLPLRSSSSDSVALSVPRSPTADLGPLRRSRSTASGMPGIAASTSADNEDTSLPGSRCRHPVTRTESPAVPCSGWNAAWSAAKVPVTASTAIPTMCSATRTTTTSATGASVSARPRRLRSSTIGTIVPRRSKPPRTKGAVSGNAISPRHGATSSRTSIGRANSWPPMRKAPHCCIASGCFTGRPSRSARRSAWRRRQQLAAAVGSHRRCRRRSCASCRRWPGCPRSCGPRTG